MIWGIGAMTHEQIENKILGTQEIVKKMQHTMYAKCGLKIVNFSPETESSEYYAHTFTLRDKSGLFRIAKKTPIKQDGLSRYGKEVLTILLPPMMNLTQLILLSLLSLTARI